MKILVGSQALRHYLPQTREPADTDWFDTDPSNAADSTRAENVFAHEGLAAWNWSGEVASLDELYTIKVSHAFWELKNNSWKKHMFDTVTLKDAGAKFLPDLYKILYALWEERYGKKKANLELSPDEFFNPNVNRVYDHDSVHASVAYRDSGIPLFNEILRDGHQVAVDKSKFDALAEEVKHQLIREEVYATALERRVIPSQYKTHPRVAYDYALMRTITSYTKGWFPLYIVQNFGDLRQPDVNYIAAHKANADRLLPFE